MKYITSPAFEPFISISFSLSPSLRNLSIGPSKVRSSLTFTYPKPFIPIESAKSSIFLNHFLDWEAASGTFIERTVFFLKGAKSVSSNISLISFIIRGFLKSGLSVPYLSIASAYDILAKGGFETSLSENSLNTLYRTSSATAKTSS